MTIDEEAPLWNIVGEIAERDEKVEEAARQIARAGLALIGSRFVEVANRENDRL